jgi:hypothetical protein
MFDRPSRSLPLLALLFVMPQTLFVIGDYMAVGIRFPFFRFQLVFQSITQADGSIATAITPSFITIIKELQFIPSGMVGSPLGRTAIATYVWFAGLIMLVAAAALVISWQVLENPGHSRYPGWLIILVGGLFILWAIIQFGPLFSGPVGYTIPVGIPFLLYSGYQFIQAAKGEEE